MPDSVTETTLPASPVNVTVVVDIWVPGTQGAAAAAAVQAAVLNYFATLPIGGLTDVGGAYANVVPFGAVEGVCYGAYPPFIQNVTLTLNGGTSNVSLTQTQIAQVNGGVVTVNVHPQ